MDKENAVLHTMEYLSFSLTKKEFLNYATWMNLKDKYGMVHLYEVSSRVKLTEAKERMAAAKG